MTGGRTTPGLEFNQGVFSAPEERCRRFTAAVVARVDASRPLRVLDVGCGTGSQLLHLAAAMPQASFTGIDLSTANIELASRTARQRGLEARVKFHAGDYLQWQTCAQDLIVSYSTLHLIPADSAALFGKIGADLINGGLLINVMPYECAYNSVLAVARRALMAVRSRFTDAVVFRVGKLLHGAEMDDEMLRERVAYMYQRLERVDGTALRKLMRRECGLEFVAEEPEVHTSLAQAKHRLAVFRKREPDR